MLARSNGPVLDAQRTFKYQTATVLRGAYFQPLSRAGAPACADAHGSEPSARYRDLRLEQKSRKLLLGLASQLAKLVP